MTDPGVPWYRRGGLLAVLALVVLAGGLAVGLALAAGEDDDDTVATEGPTTSSTVAPTTVPAVATTAAPASTTTAELSAEDRCAMGDQLGCDELSDERLDELCEEGNGNVDACQVLLARQGDGEPDGPDGEADGPGNGNGRGNGRGNANGRDDDDEDD